MSFNNPYRAFKHIQTSTFTKKTRKHKKGQLRGNRVSVVPVQIEIKDNGYIYTYKGNLETNVWLKGRPARKTIKILKGLTFARSEHMTSRMDSSIAVTTSGISYKVKGLEIPRFSHPLPTDVEATNTSPNSRFVKGVLDDIRMGRTFTITDKSIYSSSRKCWIYKLYGGEEVVGDDTPISTED